MESFLVENEARIVYLYPFFTEPHCSKASQMTGVGTGDPEHGEGTVLHTTLFRKLFALLGLSKPHNSREGNQKTGVLMTESKAQGTAQSHACCSQQPRWKERIHSYKLFLASTYAPWHMHSTPAHHTHNKYSPCRCNVLFSNCCCSFRYIMKMA